MVLVSAEGMVAVRAADGKLYSERPRTRGIAADEWSRAYNDGLPIAAWRSLAEVTCDKLGCVALKTIALPHNAVAQVEDCARASVVVAPKFRTDHCAASVVIDRTALRQHGAYAVYADGSSVTAKYGSPRPWQSGYGKQLRDNYKRQ